MELQEPLNKAHRIQRQAERDILSGRFADALLHFQLAADFFGKTVTDLSPSCSAPNDLSLQILLEQKKFCLHQVEILCLKLKQLETLKDNYRAEKLANPTIFVSNLDGEKANNRYLFGEKSMSNYQKHLNMSENDGLKLTIFDKIQKNDTLLGDLLKDRDETSKNMAENSVGNKQPKDDRCKLEELRQLNDELKGFIVKLIEDLEAKNREIEMLKMERDNLRRSSSSIPTVIVGSDLEPTLNTGVGDLPELSPLEIPTYASSADSRN